MDKWGRRESNILYGAVSVLIAAALYTNYRGHGIEAFAAVATIVLTVSVILDSRITREQARDAVDRSIAQSERAVERAIDDNQKTRDEADRPLVVAYFVRLESRINLVVQNVGSAPASEVIFEFDDPISSSLTSDFSSISLFKNGMLLMPPGYETVIAFDTFDYYVADTHRSLYQEAYGKPLPMIYRGRVKYSHALYPHRIFDEQVVLDLQFLEGQTWFVEKRVHHVAEELRQIRHHSRQMLFELRALRESIGGKDPFGRPTAAFPPRQPKVKDETIDELIDESLNDPRKFRSNSSLIDNGSPSAGPDVDPDVAAVDIERTLIEFWADTEANSPGDIEGPSE